MSLIVIDRRFGSRLDGKPRTATRNRRLPQYDRVEIHLLLNLVSRQSHSLRRTILNLNILLRVPLFTMCTKRMREYAECGHLYQIDFNRCSEYYRRNPNEHCVAPSGHLRDLPQDLDQQDRNFPGLCPACDKKTPPSSQGSM